MSRKTVLIVDDAAFIRSTLTQMLEKNGYEIVGTAEEGATALQKYSELRPDIVTMDVNMPGINGIEVLKQIKALNASAKVVMITANGQDAIIREAIVGGAANFIVKPFNEARLIEVFSRL